MINHPIPNDGFPSIHNHYPTILQLLTIIIPIYTVTTITTNNYKQSLTIIISNILLTITNNYLQLLLFSDSPKKRFAPKSPGRQPKPQKKSWRLGVLPRRTAGSNVRSPWRQNPNTVGPALLLAFGKSRDFPKADKSRVSSHWYQPKNCNSNENKSFFTCKNDDDNNNWQ